MSGVRRNVEVGLGPRAMQVPRAFHRTDYVVASLNDDTWNVTYPADILEQIIVGRKEAIVHEVVTLDARKGERELWIGESLDRFGIEKQFRGAAFPDTPRPGRRYFFLFIVSGETLVISRNHVVTFVLGNDFYVLFPHVGKSPIRSLLIEPLNLT